MCKEKADMVYHYCSFESFVKIIEKSELRFSDIMKSNDKIEVTYLWKAYLDYVKNSDGSELAEATIDNNYQSQLDNTDFFVCCFSEARDNLHMWSCYANGGVALGFRKSELIEWSDKFSLINGRVKCEETNNQELKAYSIGEWVKHENIHYYEKERIQEFIHDLCKNSSLPSATLNDRFIDIFRMAPLCKSDFWREEREWRIVIPFIYSSVMKKQSSPDKSGEILAMPDSRFGFKLYCQIPFDCRMIKEIVLAPNCKTNKSDVCKLMLANGIDLGEIISESAGSLR